MTRRRTFRVGAEPLGLTEGSDRAQTREALAEPREDGRSAGRVESLELSRGGQVVEHDLAVDDG